MSLKYRRLVAVACVTLLGAACGNVVQDGGAGGGTGGAMADACKLPAEVGQCNAAIPAFWHDAATGVCRPFTYGGCGGNANRFDTLADCQRACSGGEPDMDACSVPGDCVLTAAGCCGACDQGDARSFVAINRASSMAYAEATSCGGVACGPCAEISEFERTSQFFIAACESNRCRVLDLRQSELTSCNSDADCVLRDGAACCEGCDGTGIVVLNRAVRIEALVCDPSSEGGEACDPCVPVFPPSYFPACAAGRCQLNATRM